jgi:hypothetical protein
MVTFSPPELKQQLANAIRIWTVRLHEEVPEEIPPLDEWDGGDSDQEITPDTVLNLSLLHWEDSVEMTCASFIRLIEEFANSRFVRAVGCIWPQHALWRLTPVNPMAHKVMACDSVVPEDDEHRNSLEEYARAREAVRLLEKQLDHSRIESEDQQTLLRQWGLAQRKEEQFQRAVRRSTERRHMIDLVSGGHRIKVCLVTGFTLFSLHVVASELGHEYFPPVDESQEAFVEVISDGALTEDEVLTFVQAFIFELSATAAAEFEISPRLEVDEDPLGEYSEQAPTIPSCLRPLVGGKGMGELLAIYNRAIGTTDDELRLLCFTKVVEFVAQTVIRRQATDVIRGKLLSARAISPDAQFISELEALIEQQRFFKKDKESIKITVSQCCDATDLARLSPPFLKELLVPSIASDTKAREVGLARFAEVLYSTRNQIAHAKANYQATGDECPAEQIPQFSTCAKLAAEQVIRWFDGIPDTHRIF